MKIKSWVLSLSMERVDKSTFFKVKALHLNLFWHTVVSQEGTIYLFSASNSALLSDLYGLHDNNDIKQKLIVAAPRDSIVYIVA